MSGAHSFVLANEWVLTGLLIAYSQILGIASPFSSMLERAFAVIEGLLRRVARNDGLRSIEPFAGEGARATRTILWKHVADAFDLRAHPFEFFFDFFVAAVDVVDAVDDGFAVGD